MNIHDDDDSEYAKIIEIVAAAVAEAGKPGTFLVDLLPFIPAWFPGAGWKRKANYWRKFGEYFVNTPWNTVKEQLVA